MAILHNFIQIILACFEVWLCYQVAFATVIEKNYLSRLDKCLIWINIIGLGIALAINRNILFFSHYMLIFCVVVTWIFIVRIERKFPVLILSIVLLFYTVTSLIDFLFAFVGMLELKGQFDTIVYWQAESIEQILIFLCSRIVVAIGVGVLYKQKDLRSNILEYKNTLIFICIISWIILRQYQYALEGMSSGEYEMRPGNAGATLIFAIVMITLLEILLLKNKIIQRENRYLISRDNMNEKIYLEMQEANEKNKELVHDIKNYLSILSQYEKEKDWEKLHEYLAELTHEITMNDIPIWTGNKVLDFLLYQKKVEAENSGINFQIQTVLFSELPFTTSEICSLFGNLLDNAIEACNRMSETEKWIEFKMSKKENLLFIKVSNSTKGVLHVEGDHWISSKENKNLHGYGMKCVKRIVDKYEGEFDYQKDMKNFRIYLTFYHI